MQVSEITLPYSSTYDLLQGGFSTWRSAMDRWSSWAVGESAKWSTEHARARRLVVYLPSALAGDATDLTWQQIERHAGRIEATCEEYVELLCEVARLGLIGVKKTKDGVRITLRTPQEASEAPP